MLAGSFKANTHILTEYSSNSQALKNTSFKNHAMPTCQLSELEDTTAQEAED